MTGQGQVRRALGVLALAIASAVATAAPASAAHNPVVDVQTAACGETTVTATVSGTAHLTGNMYLVVDVDGEAQSAHIPPVDGSETSLTVGPFHGQTAETKTVSWRIFGGGERDYDRPLWDGHGQPGFGTAIDDYADEVGSFAWVIAGTDDPNPFTTWNEVDVLGCAITKDMCKRGGFADFGFRNQGQCIRFVNTGKDSR